MYSRPIERLQIDFTSGCNAKCLFCSRQDFFGNPNSHLPKNQTLALPLLEKALTDPLLKGLKEIFYCGNYGDALASPKIEEHLIWLGENYPNLRWNIHTNGSLGTVEFWQRLGRLSAKHKGLVKFSIDGLEDTNHIYRRNVEYERVIRNLQCFVQSGGRAVWKFIEFAHSRHQIALAQKFAAELGCYRFELRKNYAPTEEAYLFHLPQHPPSSQELSEKFSQLSRLEFNKKIDCRAQQENSVYLDFEGLVWPCCWIHDWKYSPTEAKRDWHRQHFFPLEINNFNSLAHFSLSEILAHPWFKMNLPNSWLGEDGLLHPTCNSTCGSVCRSQAENIGGQT
jgi:MoaA/NifB/PqqE/SkfB family radical SAM enzyme